VGAVDPDVAGHNFTVGAAATLAPAALLAMIAEVARPVAATGNTTKRLVLPN